MTNEQRQRVLGRSGKELPPIVWVVNGMGHELAQWLAMTKTLLQHQPAWIIVPDHAWDHLPQDTIAALRSWVPEATSVVLGLRSELLRKRGDRPVQDRLAKLGCSRCTAVMLESLDLSDLKAGWPFHRLGQLREQGLVELILAQAEDHASAEWLVEHTPVHGVMMRYGIDDQLARYRLLEAANELGVAILAESPSASRRIDDLQFRLGDEAVAAAVEQLPADAAERDELLAAIQHPMPNDERLRLWTEFQQRVPAPPRPRGGHVPEFGA